MKARVSFAGWRGCAQAVAVFALVGLAACRGRGSEEGGAKTPSATTTTGEDSGGSMTFSPPDACMSSDDCETSGHCIAAYDPAPSDGPPGRGAAACLDACIGESDLQRWCLDHAACCDGLRCNQVDGFCERPAGIDPFDTDGSTTQGTVLGSGSSTGTAADTSASSSSTDATGSASSDSSESGAT